MLCLAKRTFGTRLPTLLIQGEMRTPHAFLQRIIADLSKADLIETYPGPNGGVQLARPAHTISLRNVWEAIEGPLLISECIEKPEDCPMNPGCPVRSHWTHLQCTIVRELESTSLDKLVEEAQYTLLQASHINSPSPKMNTH
jgi:Rrf2 family protein